MELVKAHTEAKFVGEGVDLRDAPFIPDEVIGEDAKVPDDLCDEDSALALSHATIVASHGVVLSIFTEENSKWKGKATTPDIALYGACVELQSEMKRISKILRSKRPEQYPKRLRPVRAWATRWAKSPMSEIFMGPKKTREDLSGDTLRWDPSVMQVFRASVEFKTLAEEGGVKLVQYMMLQHKAKLHNERVMKVVQAATAGQEPS